MVLNVYLISALVLLVLLAILVYSRKDISSASKGRIYITRAFLILAVIHIFKDPDTLNDLQGGYLLVFKETWNHDVVYWATHSSDIGKMENGYLILNHLLSLISHSPFILLFTTSIVILSGHYYVIKKYSPIVWLSVLLYYMVAFNQSLFVLRQQMAMSMVLFTFPFIIEQKLKPFIIIIALTFTIHMTALVFVPLYFIYPLKSKKVILLSLLTIILFTYVMDALMTYLMGAGGLANWYLSGLGTRDLEEGQNANAFVYWLFIFLLRCIILKNHLFDDGIAKILTCITIFSVVISVIGIGFVPFARLAEYFTDLVFLIIPDTLAYVKFPKLKLAILSSFLLLNTYFYFTSWSEYVEDYDFIWNNPKGYYISSTRHG